MRKKIILVILCFVVTFFVIYLYNFNIKSYKEKNNFKHNGVIYAITKNGKKVSSFPSLSNYYVKVNCEGADGKWLYNDWKLSIDNIVSDTITCNIDFLNQGSEYNNIVQNNRLTSYIKSMVGTNQGDGKIVNENGYRYEGKNPNNYVLFNNEQYRIIGIFDQSTHGGEDEELVKIIKDDPIASPTFGTYKTSSNGSAPSCIGHNFSMGLASSVVYNYYRSSNGTTSYYCDGHKICNFKGRGLEYDNQRIIAKANWYLSNDTSDKSGLTADEFYNFERASATKNSSYVGLIYPSDYAYSVLSENCPRTTTLNNYNTSNCSSKSWLYGKGMEWTIFGEAYIYYITGGGRIAGMSSCPNELSVRPVFYLEQIVYFVDGDGSRDNPFVIPPYHVG